jgi:hypothetical protein
MNKATFQAVDRHGRALLAVFPNATEKDPVELCKKLRRVETAISRVTLQNCNVGVEEKEMDAACEKALARVKALLGIDDARADKIGLFVNRDPRGYALKFSEKWTRDYNRVVAHAGESDLLIHCDWGGYGILAPDLTIDGKGKG